MKNEVISSEKILYLLKNADGIIESSLVENFVLQNQKNIDDILDEEIDWSLLNEETVVVQNSSTENDYLLETNDYIALFFMLFSLVASVVAIKGFREIAKDEQIYKLRKKDIDSLLVLADSDSDLAKREKNIRRGYHYFYTEDEANAYELLHKISEEWLPRKSTSNQIFDLKSRLEKAYEGFDNIVETPSDYFVIKYIKQRIRGLELKGGERFIEENLLNIFGRFLEMREKSKDLALSNAYFLEQRELSNKMISKLLDDFDVLLSVAPDDEKFLKVIELLKNKLLRDMKVLYTRFLRNGMNEDQYHGEVKNIVSLYEQSIDCLNDQVAESFAQLINYEIE